MLPNKTHIEHTLTLLGSMEQQSARDMACMNALILFFTLRNYFSDMWINWNTKRYKMHQLVNTDENKFFVWKKNV